MPILIVKLCTTPTPEISRCVAAALTDLTVEILKKKRELTAVAIEYVPAAEWFIAGKTLASQPHGTFHLDIKVTQMREKPRPNDLVAKQPLGEAVEFGRGWIARTP